MWNKPKLCWIAALTGWLALSAADARSEANPLLALLAERRCEVYAPAGAAQLQQAEAAFADLLQASDAAGAGMIARWQRLGFDLRPLAVHGQRWLLLQETPGNCRGQGLYLVRQDIAPGLMLQVPHGYRDLHTDDIAAGLLQAPLHVIAFNTVPRHYTGHGRRIDADLAHRSDNFLAALTRAFTRLYPTGRLVQLHGFSADKRSTAAGRSAGAIVSSGTAWPSADAMAVADCLQALLQEPVRLYPRDVTELGATRNLQGRMLRERGHGGFVHVELNRALRERLRSGDRIRTGFAACLGNGMDEE